jgi:hypothetical protein
MVIMCRLQRRDQSSILCWSTKMASYPSMDEVLAVNQMSQDWLGSIPRGATSLCTMCTKSTDIGNDI